MKIKKVYLGQQQIYPETHRYTPNQNTIVYYDFENTLNDKSWNSHNASINSWNPTYENIWSINVINLSGKYLSTWLNTTLFNSSFTFSMWINFKQLWSLNTVAWDINGDTWWNLWFQYESSNWWLWWNTVGNRSAGWKRLIYNKPFQAQTWYNLTLVWSGSADPTLYVDWSKVTRSTSWPSGFITLTSHAFYIGVAYDTVSTRKNKNKYSDIFIENVQWTDQDVAAYYEKTKVNYWIS